MSVLDAFFNKGFKAAKCKTLLKLTIPRIKLLRNRREIQLKQMRRDIAKLLENGQEATARIRVEHIIREENMMAAQEIIELFCELIAVRLSIIETQRECPLDLKEAISSICFAAPRCSDLPELQQVQMLFAAKYGREFVAAASELLPDCGVNRQIIELLSVRAPSVEARLKLLKEIAEEHEVEWDPAASETEFLKPHEDLLNGPNHAIKDHTLPLSEENHEEPPPYLKTEERREGEKEEAESEEDFHSLNLPEVPKASVRTTSETSPSAPDLGHVKSKPSNDTTNEFNDPYYSTKETKQYQYVPFVAPPPPIPFSSPVEKNDSTPPISTNFSSPLEKIDPSPPFSPPRFSPPLERYDLNPDLFSNLTSPSEKNDPSPPFSPPRFSPPLERNDLNPGLLSNLTPPSEKNDPSPPFSPRFSPPLERNDLNSGLFSNLSSPYEKSDRAPFSHGKVDTSNVDLQDVLAAAQAAADSADRAAQAARAAASLAQIRIAGLVARKNPDTSSETREKKEAKVTEKPIFDQQDSFDYRDEARKYDDDESDYMHQPQRSVSMEGDPYFSYPNLFTKQNSAVIERENSLDEHSKFSQ